MNDNWILFKESDIQRLDEATKKTLMDCMDKLSASIPKKYDIFIIDRGHPLYEAVARHEFTAQMYREAAAIVDSWMRG